MSYKTINKSDGAVNTPVAWTAQYSTDGGTSWSTTSPDMLKSFSSLAGSGSLTGEEVDFEIAMQRIYNLPESMNTRILAMQATTVGSADNYVDVRTLADNNIGNATATANCYLVGHPGYYKLPLVYGNALKDDGSVNIVRPWNYDYGSGNANWGDLFSAPVDHNDNVIDNAYIYNKYTPADCVLLWQDEPQVIKNVHLSDDKHWLLFEVDHDHIMQCNAIVSVRDASGIIMWSWHIWVTDQTLADNTAQVHCKRNTSTGYHEFDRYLLQYPLGWCTGKETHYGSENRSMKVRFVQEDSGDEEMSGFI